MKKDKKTTFMVMIILLILLFGCISTSNFSHADSGFDTGYSGGGSYGGGYSDIDYGSSDFEGGPLSILALVVLLIIIVIRTIYKSIETAQIKKGLEQQKEVDKQWDGLTDEEIRKIDRTLSLEILTITAKSAFEKYAKNISKPNRLQSIFTDELKEKFDFESNRNRTIENIEFVDLKILELKSDEQIEFKVYYIVKCNDYTKEENKEVESYNKIIFTLINDNDLWLIKDIQD